MPRTDSLTVSKVQAIVAVVLFSLGVAVVFDAMVSETLYEMALFVGWLVVLPVVFLLGERLPFVESRADSDSPEQTNPVRSVRLQYARGEIDDAEFERRIHSLAGENDILTAERRSDSDGTRQPDSADDPDAAREEGSRAEAE